MGEGGDITDFFVRLGYKREAFIQLLKQASSAPDTTPEKVVPKQVASGSIRGSSRVERIKREMPIASVVSEYVRLRPSGNYLVGLCPFHEDHEPSLTVYPQTGTFHCYGCNKHGDVISFVQAAEQMSFTQALDALDRYRPHGTKPQ